MAETWLIRGIDKTLRNSQLSFGELFYIDGRWSRSTILNKLMELRAMASQKNGFPIEFIGYKRVGIGDYSINLHPMPYISSNHSSRKVGDSLVMWERNKFTRSEVWQIEIDGKWFGLTFSSEKSRNGLTRHFARVHNARGLIILDGSGLTRELAILEALNV